MEKELRAFEEYLRMQEKSRNTVEKYLRDVGRFASHCAKIIAEYYQ